MKTERPRIDQQTIEKVIANALSHIGSGTTFADNFRFAALALAKIAAVNNPVKRAQIIGILHRNANDEDKDDDIYGLTGIKSTEFAYIKRPLRQMDESEFSAFIHTNAQILITLQPDEINRGEMAKNPGSPEAIAYNKSLELIARGFLGMNVAPWKID